MANTTAPPQAPMKHSSWYLPADVADRLAVVVEDLYHDTRQRRKHAVLGAVVSVALEHVDEIRARLEERTGS
jgi:hypothetical protein